MNRSFVPLLLVLVASPIAFHAQGGVTHPVLSAPPQAVAATAAPSPSIATDIPASYLIGPEDTLQVTVWKEPNFTGPLTVRPDGMISMPLLGDVQAAGIAPMALSAAITERLKKFINEPNVTVTVLLVNSKRIFLVGEIQRVGPLPLSPGLTVIQAISSAGGLTAFANGKRLYILRGTGAQQKKIPFNYKQALKDGNLQGLELQPGDTIVAP